MVIICLPSYDTYVYNYGWSYMCLYILCVYMPLYNHKNVYLCIFLRVCVCVYLSWYIVGDSKFSRSICDSGTVEIIGPIASTVEDVMLV